MLWIRLGCINSTKICKYCRIEATGIVLLFPLLVWAVGCVVFRLELAMATILVPQELIASTLTSI